MTVSRWLKGLTRALCSLVLVVLVVVALVCTEWGTRWLLSLLPITVGTSEGSVLGHLTLHDVSYEDRGTRVTAKYLSFTWRPAGLLDGTFFVDQLLADGLDVSLSPTQEADQPTRFEGVKLPFKIVVANASVHQLSVSNAPPIDRVTFGLTARDQQIVIHTFYANGLGWRTVMDGSLVPSKTPSFEIAATWAQQQDDRWHSGRLLANGDLDGGDITLEMRSPFDAEVQGTWQRQGDTFAVDTRGTWQRFRWPLKEEATIYSPRGELTIAGSLDDLTIALDGEITHPVIDAAAVNVDLSAAIQTTPLTWDFAGDWQITGDTLGTVAGQLQVTGDPREIDVEHTVSTPFLIATHATVTALDTKPSFSVQTDWQKLYWPLSGAVQVNSDQGRLVVDGTPQSVTADFRGAMTLPDILTALSIETKGTYRHDDSTLDASFSWQGQTVDEVTVSGSGALTGDPSGQLAIEHQVREPFGARTTANVFIAENRIIAETQWSKLQWPTLPGLASDEGLLSVDVSPQSLTGELNAAATVDGFEPLERIVATVTGTMPGEKHWRGEADWQLQLRQLPALKGDTTLQTDKENVRFQQKLSGLFTAHSNGSWRLESRELVDTTIVLVRCAMAFIRGTEVPQRTRVHASRGASGRTANRDEGRHRRRRHPDSPSRNSSHALFGAPRITIDAGESLGRPGRRKWSIGMDPESTVDTRY